MDKMNSNKVVGSDGILIEMLAALDHLGIEKIMEITNKKYNNGEIPEDRSITILIALPKKPVVNECKLLRTIRYIRKLIHIKIDACNKSWMGYRTRTMQFLYRRWNKD